MTTTDPHGEDGDFVLEPTVFKLVWPAGEKFHGLAVRVRSLPLGLLMDAAPRIDALRTMRPEDLTTENMAEVLEPFRMVADHMVSWNLKIKVDDVLRPVPCTFEGLLGQELDFIGAVLEAWVQASGSVSAPLELPSSSGDADALLAESIPMTPSLPSSAAPA